jgi:hypothetical protein
LGYAWLDLSCGPSIEVSATCTHLVTFPTLSAPEHGLEKRARQNVARALSITGDVFVNIEAAVLAHDGFGSVASLSQMGNLANEEHQRT